MGREGISTIPSSNEFAALEEAAAQLAPTPPNVRQSQGPSTIARAQTPSAPASRPTAWLPGSFRVASNKQARKTAQKLAPLTEETKAQVCLLVGNHRGPDHKWTFRSTHDSWKVPLRPLLDKKAYLLVGCKRIQSPVDTRICIRTPTPERAVELLLAINATRQARAFAYLTPQQK